LSLTGRLEICIFLILYILTLSFQLLTTGAILEQGTKPLVVLTTILAGRGIVLGAVGECAPGDAGHREWDCKQFSREYLPLCFGFGGHRANDGLFFVIVIL